MRTSIFRFMPLFLGMVLLLPTACDKKDEPFDKRNQFVGTYSLSGPCRFVFDAFGQYREEMGTDTAYFKIVKAKGTDSLDYVYLEWVIGDKTYLTFSQEGGRRVAATVNENTVTIPYQLPFEAVGKSIDGSGTVEGSAIQFQYHTFYRGYHKYATLTGNRQ